MKCCREVVELIEEQAKRDVEDLRGAHQSAADDLLADFTSQHSH